MRITLDYCRNCYGFFNKINSYIHWIFIEHSIISWLLVALIIASCGLIHYEVNLKDEILYPLEAYEELEEIAISHATKHNSLTDFSALPENVDYSCSISKGKITSTYSVPGTTRFFINLIVTVEQEGTNFEQITTSRNFTEDNYISEFRELTLILFVPAVGIAFLGLVGFLLFITSQLNKIGLEERRRKYYDLYYSSSGKKIDEESKNSDTNDDITNNKTC